MIKFNAHKHQDITYFHMVMAVEGRKMWCVIWCDGGWRIRMMPVLLQISLEIGLG